MTSPADGIRHLVGVVGDAPTDTVKRARFALRALVGDSVVTVEEGGFLLATGPASSFAGRTGSSLCVAAGPLYDRVELGETLGLTHEGEPDRFVVVAFERWGEDLLDHLTTEAAVLVWDREARRGFVARDRLGASSLFWCREGGAIVFATELNLLLALLRRRPAPDPTGIALWLGRSASHPELTLYEGVRELEVGHRLRLGSHGASPERYWRPTYEPPEPLSMDAAAELVRPALRRAVERRLSPTGPTGILLSGGIDSTATAGAALAMHAELRAYSTVFPDHPQLDETRWIDEMAAVGGLPVVKHSPEQTGLLTDTADFVRRWSAPPDGWTSWNQPLYRQAAADGVSVLLTGEIAEALFDGRFSAIGDRLRAGRLIEAGRLVRRVPLGFSYPTPRSLLRIIGSTVLPAAAPTVGRRAEAARDRRQRPRWLRPELADALNDAAGVPGWQKLDGPAWWARAVYDLTSTIPALGLIRYLRRRGEVFGIDARTPYVDLDLVQLSLRLPPELSLNPALTKPVLRAASQGQIPDSVRLRPTKTLWNPLVIEMVAGDEWSAVRTLLADPSPEIAQFVHHDLFVHEMLEHRPSQGGSGWPWAAELIRLVGLEIWLRHEAGRSR